MSTDANWQMLFHCMGLVEEVPTVQVNNIRKKYEKPKGPEAQESSVPKNVSGCKVAFDLGRRKPDKMHMSAPASQPKSKNGAKNSKAEPEDDLDEDAEEWGLGGSAGAWKSNFTFGPMGNSCKVFIQLVGSNGRLQNDQSFASAGPK